MFRKTQGRVGAKLTRCNKRHRQAARFEIIEAQDRRAHVRFIIYNRACDHADKMALMDRNGENQ